MDLEETLKAVVDQQARFSADVAEIHGILRALAEAEKRTNERQDRTEQTFLDLGAVVLEVANAQTRTNEMLATLSQRQVGIEEWLTRLAENQSTLVDSQKELVDSQKKLADSQRMLADKQRTTEENLNILLLTVERHIADHK